VTVTSGTTHVERRNNEALRDWSTKALTIDALHHRLSSSVTDHFQAGARFPIVIGEGAREQMLEQSVSLRASWWPVWVEGRNAMGISRASSRTKRYPLSARSGGGGNIEREACGNSERGRPGTSSMGSMS